MREEQAEILVVGGGVGGVAAALAAARSGSTVVLTEETDWLGGQFTSQSVPPDEHPWIEQFGCTATYRRLREGIRDYYRRWYPLTEAARAVGALNPGAGRVSSLCHEPRVALAVIEAMLAPHRASGRLRILTRHQPIGAAVDHDRIQAVDMRGLDTGEERTVAARWVIDATETGKLLDLAGVEHVTGAESRRTTGEPHARREAQPENMQAVSICFAVDHAAGENHVIDRPADYAYWRDYQAPIWPDRQLSLTAPHPRTLAAQTRSFVPNPDDDPLASDTDLRAEGGDLDLWTFRRIAARKLFAPGAYDSDITLVNWPQIDYFGGPVFGVADAEHHLRSARQLSLSMLYWLQTEAPRPDGGTGWPGLRLRADVVGTDDGLAKAPYIRESRRIVAERTVVEQDLALDIRGEQGAVHYPDSVGVGSYRIDLHPSTGGDNYIDIPACPYEIPLGALIPVRVDNLLAGGKCIGSTHITNGCYRLHPTEWNVGEVAGLLAAFCSRRSTRPRAVRATGSEFADFSAVLRRQGVETRWPEIHAY